MFPAFSLAQRLIVVPLLALAPPVFAEDQEFRLERPDAQSVGLAGEFNDWKSQPMAKGNDGIWTVTVLLPPGSYGYKFLVNGGEWLFDPRNPQRKQVNGIENSAIEVREDNTTPLLVSPTPVRRPGDDSICFQSDEV